jgi:hypothetical protein
MKLAEALILRADQQKRLQQLKQRLIASARVQEGEAPPEEPGELLVELERVAADLANLVKQINRTTSNTPFANSGTLSDALAERDGLAQRRGVYADLAQAASVRQDRYSRSEVKFISTVNVAELQRTADTLARDFRELDARIQELNWQTELAD